MKNTLKIVFISALFALLLNVFFGRWLGAKVSTLPLLNRFKILQPLTPIVINNREVIRVSENGSMSEVAQNSQAKLSSVVKISSGKVTFLGGAINITSEGLFLTTKAVVAASPAETLRVKLSDGNIVEVNKIISDTASELVLLQTSARNISVASFAESSQLKPAENILFLAVAASDASPIVSGGYVHTPQGEIFGKIFNSDFPERGFEAHAFGNLTSGQALINFDGQVVGVWDGEKIISSDIIRFFIQSFLNNNQQVVRPSFGFRYKILTETEQKLLTKPFGAEVIEVFDNSMLRSGDIILQINGQSFTLSSGLEQLLEKYKPSDKILLTILRGKDTIELELTVKSQTNK